MARASSDGEGLLMERPQLQVIRDDGAELRRLEHLISDRLSRTFVEVGQALARIRDEDLYREAGFRTFEAYCRERWDMGRNYANKQIAAAEVVSTIVPKGLPAPSTESQARELAKLQPKDQVKAWCDAVKAADASGVPVTARLVREMDPSPSERASTPARNGLACAPMRRARGDRRCAGDPGTWSRLHPWRIRRVCR